MNGGSAGSTGKAAVWRQKGKKKSGAALR